MKAQRYTLGLDGNGHWLVSSGPSGKPIAVFYTHNISARIARHRAEKFIEAMR